MVHLIFVVSWKPQLIFTETNFSELKINIEIGIFIMVLYFLIFD